MNEMLQGSFESAIIDGPVDEIRGYLLLHFHKIKHTDSFRLIVDRLEREMGFKDALRKENTRLVEGLKDVRIVLGDFLEPWNEREKMVDSIAKEVLNKPKEDSNEE